MSMVFSPTDELFPVEPKGFIIKSKCASNTGIK
jgi:hypothetical protein